jgi:hypothetical protein
MPPVTFGSTIHSQRRPPPRSDWPRINFLTSRQKKTTYSTEPARMRDLLRWRIRSIANDLLRQKPRTPPDVYLETMGQIVRAISEKQAIPVVLSPFVFGGQRSNRIARDCAWRLRQLLATIPYAHFWMPIRRWTGIRAARCCSAMACISRSRVRPWLPSACMKSCRITSPTDKQKANQRAPCLPQLRLGNLQ